MSISNGTLIQLKYSEANSSPSSLQISEPAYSFVSDKLFIGDLVNNPIAIGGKFYTGLLDANTSYAVPNTIVTRDFNGSSDFNNLMANTISANSTIFAGLADASPLSGATNPLIGAGGNANNYIQNYIRNVNAGTEASADFVAYSDDGSDVSGWVDMGITSSNYASDNFTVTGPNEGYLFMSATNGSGASGNLVIATDSTGVHNDIVFQTGGFTGAKHPIMSLRNGQGLVVETTTSSSGNSSGALVVNGGAGIKGALYADEVYDGGSRVLSSASVNSGAGIDVSTSISGNTETITINNTGVLSLSANSGETTVSDSTGNLTFGLADTTVTAGTYGGASQIPTITVDSKGRVTYAGNSTISTSFTLDGDSGSVTVNGGDTLTIYGGDGITSTAGAGPELTLDVDDTVVRSNTAGAYQTIDGVLNITGDLNVTGNISYTDVATIITQNSLIFLANNNTTSDVVDIGFVGESYNGDNVVYTGLFRHAGDSGKDYYLFDNYTTNPDGTFVIDPTDASFRVSTLHANLIASVVTSGGFLAQEGNPTGIGGTGYSFQGDGGYDTGMFSPSDGIVQLWSNDVLILEGSNGNGFTLQNGAKLEDTSANSIILGFNLQDSGHSQRVSIGYQESNTPQTGQSWDAISIGARAGTTNQHDNAIAIGNRAGANNQSESAVAIGGGSGGNGGAGQNNQGNSAVAIGNHAGQETQGQESVAIGKTAGQTSQGYKTVAIGSGSGETSQGAFSVAVGLHAGQTNQQNSSVAVGHVAGQTGQGADSVAVGVGAGINYQGFNSVAVGNRAGAGYTTPQGNNAIAIGASAGYYSQVDNSIALNASGAPLNPANSGFFVNPVRHITTANVMYYNASTSEVTYGGLDAGTISTGTLGVTYGGTGASTFSVKGVIVSDNGSTTGALSALTGSAYQVLQLDASGIPTFSGISGGTF